MPPPVPTELRLLRREVEVERRRLVLQKENGILYYIPHHKQYEFHIADFRFRHARFANQTGKSEMGAVEDLSHALGYRPFMERRFDIIDGEGKVVGVHEGHKGHPYATLGISPRPTVGCIIVQDWEKSKEIFTEQEGTNKGKLFTYLPKDAFVDASRNHSGVIDRIIIKHRSGGVSTIRIETVKSYKQDPQSLESSIWDWIHVDEPCPEGMFKAAARGLMARNGRSWLNLTPLTEPWIQDMFIPDGNQLDDDIGNMVNGDKTMLVANMYDNPYLTPEGREAYIALLTDDEKICRVQGIPAAYSGIVYKEFKYNQHILKNPPTGWVNWNTPPADYTLRFAIDYHPRKNNHVLFIATSPLGVHYVYAELWTDTLVNELVSDIKTCLCGRESTVPGLIDPLADVPNRQTDVTSLEEIVRLGLPVIAATKDPHNGIIAVKTLLKTRDRIGLPIIFVNPNCKRFIFEISRGFIWDEDTNKPVKLNDDAMENFYRLCLQGLTYIEPSSATDYAPIKRRESFDNVVDASNFFERPAAHPERAQRYATGTQMVVGAVIFQNQGDPTTE